MPQSDGNATPLTQSQVVMYFCEYFLSDVRGIGGTEPVILFRVFFLFFFQPWKISVLLRSRNYNDESRLQGAVS